MNQTRIENLTANQCLAGAKAALANAQSLILESELLYTHQFFARAYSLAHFSREELGKVLMLVATGMRLISGVVVDWRKLDKRFRSHSKKIVNERLQAVASTPAKYAVEAGLVASEEDWFNLAIVGAKGAKYWEERRNDSLYTDWNGTEFIEPTSAITSNQASRTLQLAKLAVDDSSRAVAQLSFWVQLDPDEARLHWAAVAAEIEQPRSEEDAIERFLESAKVMHAIMTRIDEAASCERDESGLKIQG